MENVVNCVSNDVNGVASNSSFKIPVEGASSGLQHTVKTPAKKTCEKGKQLLAGFRSACPLSDQKIPRRKPRSIHLDGEYLINIATSPESEEKAVLDRMDSEICSLKRQVQRNKQIIAELKNEISPGIDEFRFSRRCAQVGSAWNYGSPVLQRRQAKWFP